MQKGIRKVKQVNSYALIYFRFKICFQAEQYNDKTDKGLSSLWGRSVCDLEIDLESEKERKKEDWKNKTIVVLLEWVRKATKSHIHEKNSKTKEEEGAIKNWVSFNENENVKPQNSIRFLWGTLKLNLKS